MPIIPGEMEAGLKVLHDLMLKPENIPDGQTAHDESACPICAMNNEGTTSHVDPEGGSMSDPKTYSEDELNAAVTAAVNRAVADAKAPLEQRLSELESDQGLGQLAAAIADARAEVETKVTELQTELDTMAAELATTKTTLAETETFWAEAIAESERQTEAEARRDERLAVAKRYVTEEFLEKHADRYVAMADEDWDARVEEWKDQQGDGNVEIPVATAMTASRVETPVTASASTATVPAGSMLGEIPGLRRSGLDPRKL